MNSVKNLVEELYQLTKQLETEEQSLSTEGTSKIIGDVPVESKPTPPLVKFKKLHENATVPKYQSAGASGMDLALCEPITIGPNQRVLAKTGLAVAIPEGYEGQVRSRSGLTLKFGIVVLNSPGTIDSDFRAEIGVILFNTGDAPVELNIGNRVAQLVICPVSRVEIVETVDLGETERGAGGFGSTGV